MEGKDRAVGGITSSKSREESFSCSHPMFPPKGSSYWRTAAFNLLNSGFGGDQWDAVFRLCSSSRSLLPLRPATDSVISHLVYLLVTHSAALSGGWAKDGKCSLKCGEEHKSPLVLVWCLIHTKMELWGPLLVLPLHEIAAGSFEAAQKRCRWMCVCVWKFSNSAGNLWGFFWSVIAKSLSERTFPVIAFMFNFCENLEGSSTIFLTKIIWKKSSNFSGIWLE